MIAPLAPRASTVLWMVQLLRLGKSWLGITAKGVPNQELRHSLTPGDPVQLDTTAHWVHPGQSLAPLEHSRM